MSKFFIAFTVLFFLSCGGGEKPYFSTSHNLFLEFFYQISSHPAFLEKESILLGITNRIKNEDQTLKDYLYRRLITDGNLIKLQSNDPIVTRALIQELESIQNLGGLRIQRKEIIQFSYGDWTDLYSDGYSKGKLKKSSLIQKLSNHGDLDILFFIRNHSGYQPVDFSFVGFESQFFLFQGDGTLRLAKSDFVDYSMRHEKFKDLFSKIKKMNPNAEILNYEDFTLYYLTGSTPIFFYIFLTIRILMLISVIVFSFFGIREWKEYRLKSLNERVMRNSEVEHAKQILSGKPAVEETSNTENSSPQSEKSEKLPENEKNSIKKLEEGKKESVDLFIQKVTEEKSEEAIQYSKIEKIG